MKRNFRLNKFIPVLVICLLVVFMTGCTAGNNDTNTDNTNTGTPVPTEQEKNNPTSTPNRPPTNWQQGSWSSEPTVTEQIKAESVSGLAKEQNKKEKTDNNVNEQELRFYSDGSFEFSEENHFYYSDVVLTITAPEGATVYYTLDGREPYFDSRTYKEPLKFEALGGEFPDAYTFRACMINPDGTTSEIAARSFLVGKNLENRFSTLVFFISGDPDQLDKGPNGIMYGNNALERGRDTERMVYIEAFEADGTEIFSQFGGVRVYGGYSRQYSLKSFKLFSRKMYDEKHKNFKIDNFQTPKLNPDEEGEVIKTYDKLVLRNGGNDYQFGFIRDELSQKLCKKAGFDTYEEVIPAVVYLNGSYYAFHWLHENYCDKYFKERFGDAEGEFIVAEGTDQLKDDDEDIQYFVDEYNARYEKYAYADLTNDSIYNELCNYIDINSYLDFFAWNIALNNWDWPNNNFKCYRYVPADGESLSEGVFDGKWRFLPHDMDYTYNIYDQAKAMENYNTLRVIMDKNNERYSPLFTQLMQRKDCRDYFRNKTMEYLNGALSEQSIKEEYEKLHALRKQELTHFYNFLEVLNRRGDWTIWTQASNYANNEKQIYSFAEKRQGYVFKYMDELLPEH